MTEDMHQICKEACKIIAAGLLYHEQRFYCRGYDTEKILDDASKPYSEPVASVKTGVLEEEEDECKNPLCRYQGSLVPYDHICEDEDGEPLE